MRPLEFVLVNVTYSIQFNTCVHFIIIIIIIIIIINIIIITSLSV